ncbi:dUTP diphosphatase [Alkalicoccus chagannorensis]|uniref:dUTP diphosphatase n=1 Tax=Alkalicoccus chagannorensis TaxID=427072 RepID=UPI00047ED97D|nr:dUTP diphosphatase [Alkalicoccus chagannorensis]
MDLKQLFDMQRNLDEDIVANKGLEGVDTLPDKVLALIVELGECANEWRGFKFWSEDQEPRNEVVKIIACDNCDGTSIDPVIQESCAVCEGDGVIGDGYENKLLEEYVDCLHFLLSIGLEIDDEIGDWDLSEFHSFMIDDITEQFTLVSQVAAELRGVKGDEEREYFVLKMAFSYFLGLGEMLGFSWEDITEAYMDKNKTNHERQVNGY